MSRSIDTAIVASLHKGDSQEIYINIANALCPNPPAQLEIEFLGSSHPLPPGRHFLQDGKSIAIPKSKLVQAFLVAKQLFFTQLRPCSDDQQDELLRATAVILLMDPEHLTAANERKRFIKRHLGRSDSEHEDILRRELLFVDNYLTSRLHRHSKSPTLWGHRRWLLKARDEATLRLGADSKSVILVAAERHPRNYYAWLHLRWLVLFADELDREDILPWVKDWCWTHPSDTSGFSVLLFYFSHVQNLHGIGPETEERIEASTSCCIQLLGLAASFKWTHESVWTFLRTMVGMRIVSTDCRKLFFDTIEVIGAANVENSIGRKTLQAARDWCLKYEL